MSRRVAALLASQSGAKAHIGAEQIYQGEDQVASMGLNIEEQKAVDKFRKEVAEPSMTNLVVLDFWAEWCGPCKALTPVLEKVCGEYADKGVILAKVNVDEEQFIAAQFQVRSIPTVYRDVPGPAGRRPDQCAHRIAAAAKRSTSCSRSCRWPVPMAVPQREVAQFVAMGEEVLAGGDGERAAGIFAQIDRNGAR